MTVAILRSPPGSYGLPFLGTLLGTAEFFLLGWERFFRVRRQRHDSTVFKVNLFQPTVAVLDRNGIEPLFADSNLIQDYGFSWAKPPPALTGGIIPSIFLHGAAHDWPKDFFLSLIQEELQSLPLVFSDTAPVFFSRWAKMGQFFWVDEIERYAVSVLFDWILGARPNVDEVRYIYNNIFLHMFPKIEQLIPWSSYNRSIVYYQELVEFIRTAPRFKILAQRARGFGIGEEALPHRLAFFLGMNAYLGLQSLLKSTVAEITRHAEVRHQLRAQLVAGGQATELPLLDRVIREVLRLHPPVFFIFGRSVGARTISSSSGEFELRDGDLLMGVIPFSQRDPAIFTNPDEFDPQRYDAPGAREGLIWPRGLQDAKVSAGDRSCPGKDPALILGKLFSGALVAGYEWRLATVPRWTQGGYSLNVAAPEGRMQVGGFSAVP